MRFSGAKNTQSNSPHHATHIGFSYSSSVITLHALTSSAAYCSSFSLKPTTRVHPCARARREREMPPQLHRSLLLLYVAAAAAAALPDPAPLDPGLFLPSATPAQPGAATIPAFPEQSDAAAGGASSTCPLAPSPWLLPAVLSSCDADGALPARLRCCPALAAWLFAAYAPVALAAKPVKPPPSAAPVDMPVPPDDSEACAGAAERALRSEGAALPRPPGANGTCDVAFCYCGVRLRRLTCGAQPTGNAGMWSPADAAARRLERDCAKPGVHGCSKCLRALATVR
ncbi:hypothetical protein BRADI_3g53080v3 [Brachypodium distachyon]|uniref:Uncharacterized protein n=1 Tax=Brachypodium distachyon TaxID=15368 RepID=A0A2K2D4U3_BRADI|nr:hypothetical protein BRADI_3g53080v3 [Brachypodium distachyon]